MSHLRNLPWITLDNCIIINKSNSVVYDTNCRLPIEGNKIFSSVKINKSNEIYKKT